jgi:hypothetical protein
MTSKGGARPGAGRKPKALEQHTSNICKQAIQSTYGGNCKAMQALLATGEVPLIKFVFEHAFGRPIDKQEIKMQKLGTELEAEIYI